MASILHLRLLSAMLTVAAVVAAGAKVEAASLPLTWNAPTTSADGTPLTDLSGYRIYLGTSTPTCPSASFHTVASPISTPSTGQTISTRITHLNTGTTYVARVTAVDFAGNESGCSASVSGAAQPDFSVTPTGTTDFGSVAVNGTVDRNFTVQNISPASISVTASVGSPFSIVSGGSGSLAAGANRTVTVRFRPTTTGSFAGNVNFTSGVDTLSRALTGSSTGSSTTFVLTVTKNGTGAGTVTSSPAGISCGTDCGESLMVGTPVTLTASAASGSIFAGWGGACTGTAATCSWTMGGSTTVTATFDTDRVDRSLEPSPVPVIRSLSPTSKPVRSAAFTLTVNGSRFVATSVVRWNGFNRPTTFVSSRRLVATIPATDLTASGWFPVSVFTPEPGGGTTGTLNFAVTAPTPTVSSLSPATAPAGTPGLSLTVNGAGFVPASIVSWNGTSRATTFVSPTQVQTIVTPADLAGTGSMPVRVVTPAPGGGTSATSLSFNVTAPTTSTATPPATPGSPTVTRLVVDAAGVTSDVAWAAASGATSYRYAAAFNDGSASQQGTVSGLLSFQLRMPYHSSGTAFGGYVCIRSVGSTGLLSAHNACSPLSVPAPPAAAPAPVVSSLSPNSAVAGGPGLTLTVNGSGFAAASVVRWNSADRPTMVVSSTQLRAAISATDLASSGSVPVTVFTPAPGGGTSASQSFTITVPASSTPPGMPGNPTVTMAGKDATGVTFNVTWSPATGATSYRYIAAFSDGSASQQGTVASTSMQLRMPYHSTGAAFGAFVCIRAANAAGQLSADHACAPFTVLAQ